MLTAYIVGMTPEIQPIRADNQMLLQQALWIDILTPTKLEEQQLEKSLKIEIPTRDDMVEIELSSRLYKENNTYYMTATMIAQHESLNPILEPVTFILTPEKFITLRYIEPKAFKLFTAQMRKLDSKKNLDAFDFLIELFDATIDRLADTLELIGRRLDEDSKSIFRPDAQTKLDYRELMQQIGANGELNTKARESLVTFNRLILFLINLEDKRLDNEKQVRLAGLAKDIDSLRDHANFLSTKVNFILDATLGMINIEQNNIIKIFSVAAVIFLPPTLVASIYGMNFHFIPELKWKYGYVFAIAMILVAAWLPYKYFKYRKWL